MPSTTAVAVVVEMTARDTDVTVRALLDALAEAAGELAAAAREAFATPELLTGADRAVSMDDARNWARETRERLNALDALAWGAPAIHRFA